ncbi:MAG TPA: hypothetical protein VGA98_03385 [Allosphingosinicella sp.]|jgi:hypothetical protein
MPTVQRETPIEGYSVPERSAWTRPEFARLETGEAEAQDGSGTDSSGFLS